MQLQTLAVLVGPASALIGVAIGGLLSYRIQARTQDLEGRRQLYSDRQRACADFLAAVRSYRRYVLTSPDVSIKVVNQSDVSKGAIVVEGGDSKIILGVNDALARVMVVVEPSWIVEEADQLLTGLNNLTRRRAELGQGNIPNDEFKLSIAGEKQFAEHVRRELQKLLEPRRRPATRVD